MKPIGVLFTGAMLLSATAFAQPPKATPSITGNFCVNNTSGIMRNILVKNNVVQACHKNEQQVTVVNLDSAPTPSPGPTATADPTATATGDPTASATPTATSVPTASPTPVACTNCVIDANGTEVGQLYETGSDPEFNQQVILNIQGVDLSLPVTEDGFVNFQSSGIDTIERFPTDDCSGQGYIAVAVGNDTKPLVESWAVQMGPYVYGTTVYFAQPPFVNIKVFSVREFVNASQQGQCEPALQGTDLGTYVAGTPASADLNAFGFVTPFDFK